LPKYNDLTVCGAYQSADYDRIGGESEQFDTAVTENELRAARAGSSPVAAAA
jgi:hypothetical protein